MFPELSYRRVWKRVLDVALSLVGLVVVLPLVIALAGLLALAQGRPVFFSQTRIGRDFVPFKLYKFRSMAQSGATLEAGFAPQLGDRRTPIGRVVRATKLDELPQLLNVLRGDMSLVGPRPEVPDWVDTECGQWQQVLSVRPGITDPASLHFFDEEEQLRLSESPDELYRDRVLPEKLRLASDYARNITFTGDLRILLQTGVQLFRR